jgi:hypothetical protein
VLAAIFTPLRFAKRSPVLSFSDSISIFSRGLGIRLIQAPGTLGTTAQNIDQKITHDNFPNHKETKLASPKLLSRITHILGGYGTYGFIRNTLEIR